MKAQKDNSTIVSKVAMRRSVMAHMESPVVMETHGGYGRIYQAVYSDVPTGVVFERDNHKAEALACQRPSWRVYQSDCDSAIRHGVANDLPVNLYDIDPYGSPWPTIDAICESGREWPARIAIVVNDGLRQKLKISGWDVDAVREYVEAYGEQAVYSEYLDICQDMLVKRLDPLGYDIDLWAGRYCGHAQQMSHYAAVFTLRGGATMTGGAI